MCLWAPQIGINHRPRKSPGHRPRPAVSDSGPKSNERSLATERRVIHTVSCHHNCNHGRTGTVTSLWWQENNCSGEREWKENRGGSSKQDSLLLFPNSYSRSDLIEYVWGLMTWNRQSVISSLILKLICSFTFYSTGHICKSEDKIIWHQASFLYILLHS